MRTIKIAKKSELHKRIIKKIDGLWDVAKKGRADREDIWRQTEETVLAYVHESEVDSVRRNKRESQGKPTYTTIQIPYTYALLMSAHTYWTSVFFARTPVHQYSGRHGETEIQVQAMEALTAYQVEVGNMLAPYYIWLYDGGKYGMGVLGTYWDVEKIHYGQVVEIPPQMEGGEVTYAQVTQEIPGYTGNKVYNVSPYDFWADPRVPIGRFQDGEFCIVRTRMGWSKILRRKDNGYFTNFDEFKEHKSESTKDTHGSSQLKRPDLFTETLYDDHNDNVGHASGGTFLEFYIELVPSEWGLGDTKFPMKWCITVTEDRQLIVGASPLGYIHAKFPFDIVETEIEGYGQFNRGMPEIIRPIQNTMDWLINSHFYNVRAALNIQAIVDPSKLIIKNNGGPGFIWQLRPEAYGADITKMFHQIPVTDVTRGHMSDLQSMLQVGERTLGVNDQIMGALSGTNRKTATEVRTSTGFGVNRLKTITEYMSATGFASHSQKLVSTSQQMYDGGQKLRIVGDLAIDAGMPFMQVTPELIAGSYNFVPVDGALPVDRMAQAALWKEMMGSLRSMPPQVLMEYDWGRIFAWVAQLGGLKNIRQFKIQVMPPGMTQPPGVQAGNVIPMPARGGSPVAPGAAVSTMMGNNALMPQQ